MCPVKVLPVPPRSSKKAPGRSTLADTSLIRRKGKKLAGTSIEAESLAPRPGSANS